METWPRENLSFTIKFFSVYRFNGKDEKGGIATLYKNYIPLEKVDNSNLKFHPNFQFQGMKLLIITFKIFTVHQMYKYRKRNGKCWTPLMCQIFSQETFIGRNLF